MTERDNGVNFPDNFRSDKERQILSGAWQDLFLALKEFAEIREQPANGFAPVESIKHHRNDPEYEYNLRINPALLTPEGELEILVLDVTFMGEPSQQWVAKAQWQNGKPNLVGLDSSTPSEEGEGFDSERIARLATRIVKKYQYVFLTARENPSMVISAPEGYSAGIN